MSRIAAPNRISLAAGGLIALALVPVQLDPHGVARMALFAFFSRVCHQHADRSLILFGVPSAVCVRCLGVYVGAALGSVVCLGRTYAVRMLLAALTLNSVDVLSEMAGIHGSLPVLRAALGLGLGFAVGTVLGVSDEEIAGGLSKVRA